MQVFKTALYSLVGVSMVFYTFALALVAVPSVANAAYGYPTSIGYQGRLKDSAGAALTGTYDFRFNFYDALTAGTLVNAADIDVANVTVTNGYFTAPIPILGADLGQFIDDLYLYVQVAPDGGAYDALSPRVQINKTAYSIFAQAIETNTTAPTTSLFEGRVYYDPDTNAMNVYTGSAFVEVSNTMDDAYDAFGGTASKVVVDALEGQTGGLEWSIEGSDNFIVDLQSTGDFVVQNAGTAYATFDDSGTTTLVGPNTRTTQSVLAITDASTDGVSGNLIDVNVSGTSDTNSIDLTYSGVATGNAIDLNMATNVAGDAINIATSATTGSAIDIVSSGVVGAGNGLINIDMAAGDWQGNVFDVTTGGNASDGNVFDVTLEALDVDVQNMVVDNKAASSVEGWGLKIDSTTNAIWTTAAIDITTGSGDVSGEAMAITLESGATDARAITIFSSADSDQPGWLMKVDTTSVFTTNMFDIDLGAQASTGDIMNVSMGITNIAGGAFVVADAGGARSDAIIDITTASTGSASDAAAIMQINASGALDALANVIDLNISGAAASNILDVAMSSTATGNVLNIDMDAAVAATAMRIDAGGGIRTQPLMETVFDGAGTTVGGTLWDVDVSNTGAAAEPLFDVDLTTAYTGNVLDITYQTLAGTGNAIDLNMGTNVEGMAISINSAATGFFLEGAAVNVEHSGNLVAGANVASFYSSGDPSSTSHVMMIKQDTGAGTTGAYGLEISTTGTNVEALHIDDGVSVFDERIDFFGLASGQNIVGDVNDLTIGSSRDIDLAATTNINVPVNVGLTFGTDDEFISGDGTSLAIGSSGVLDLSTTSSAAGGGALDLTAAATSAWTVANGDLTIALNEGDGSGVLLVTVGDVFGVPPSINGDDMYFAAESDIAFAPGEDMFVYVGSDSQLVVDATGFVAPGEDMVLITNAGQPSTTTDVDALQITFAATGVTGNVIDISPTFGGGNSTTNNVININDMTVTANAGTQEVFGLNIGNLTEAGAGAVASGAISVGTGWEFVFQSQGLGITQSGTMSLLNMETIDNAVDGTIAFRTNGEGDPIFSVSTDALSMDLGPQQSAAYLCHSINGSTGVVDVGDCSGTPADLAELYGTDGTIESGDVVVASGEATEFFDEIGGYTSKAYVSKAEAPYATQVIGIVSTNPNMTFADGIFDEDEYPVPVTLTGRIPVKVTNENGAIKTGDRLAASSRPGYAMKATEPGWSIGTALQSFDEDDGKIITFMSISWFVPGSEGTDLQGGDSSVADQLSDVDSISLNTALFDGSVTVAEHLYGSRDMAGRARLSAGEKTVDVTFDVEYAYTPIVTFSLRTDEHVPGQVWVSDESTTGFTINHSAGTSTPYDLEFNWIAIGVDDLFVSVSNAPVVETVVEVVVEEAAAQEEVVEAEAEDVTIVEVVVEEEVVIDEPAEEAAEEEIVVIEEPVQETVVDEVVVEEVMETEPVQEEVIVEEEAVVVVEPVQEEEVVVEEVEVVEEVIAE